MRLIFLAAAWIAGTLVGLETNAYLPSLISFAIAAVVLALIFRIRGFSLWIPILALVMVMGIIRVETSEDTLSFQTTDRLHSISIRGVVADDPELAASGVEFVLGVDAIDTGEVWEDGEGSVLVIARPPRELVQKREAPYFRYGDRLELTGSLDEPPILGEFDYRTYLANQGIHFTMAFPDDIRLVDTGKGNPALGKIYDLRGKLAQGIDGALAEPEASLAQALLLGLRGRLPQDITEDFRSTGTSHLLAISGMHVGVVLMISVAAGAWLVGRRRQIHLLLPLAAIWLYALFAGFSPSVERAAIMGTVYLVALAIGRSRSILPVLALTAVIMVGIEPQALKQISFQLSFTAVAGSLALLVGSGSPLSSYISALSVGSGGWPSVLLRGLVLTIAVSLAATLATLPLIAFNFHRIPTLGIPATVLALPALPILLVTSAGASVGDLIHPQLGTVLGWIAWVPLQYVLKLVQLFAQVPGSTFSVPAFNPLLVWVYYGVFALLLVVPGSRLVWSTKIRRLLETLPKRLPIPTKTASRIQFPIGMYLITTISLSVLAGFLWFYVVTGPDGRLHVHYLDVGQGDSTFIVTPNGTQVLVDGGPDPREAARAVGDRTPFWDRNLDMVVLTHPDEDHFRGLVNVLDRYEADVVLESGRVSQNPLYLEWEKVLEGRDVNRQVAAQGQIIVLDEAAWMEVLNPPSDQIVAGGSELNNSGVILRLVYGNLSFLLTADIEGETEARLLREGLPLRSTVLKVAHHGSKTSTTPRFLSAVSPAAAVISAGADNQYGHPHPDVTTRLKGSVGSELIYVTAERGDIEFITDGERLWVKTER